MIKLLDLVTHDFKVCQISTNLWSLIDNTLEQNIKYIIVINDNSIIGILNINTYLKQFLGIGRENLENKCLTLNSINYSLTFDLMMEDTPILNIINYNSDVILVLNKKNEPIGVIDSLRIVHNLIRDSINIKETIKHEYKKIFENFEEEIFVTDQNGYVSHINPAAERVCGIKSTEIMGKHVSELQSGGIISSSITMLVLHQKKKVSIIQQLKSGKKVISTAVPVFDDEGEIDLVISTSKDYEEISKLKSELEEKKTELERTANENLILRNESLIKEYFIFDSKEMKNIKDIITKVGLLDITILIEGESGVGKEVITKAIHQISLRRNEPLIKINCGLIPENLIESELFGYESGAFTGATKGGKIGKIELANNGTLFLDEIGELPLMSQVKLLEFLQDREITRVGSTNKIKINTRVIGATNRCLKDMVKEGKFRKDLFYRLNVLPLNVPPLRERREDIPVLIEHFLSKFSSKYGIKKKIAPEVRQTLYNYSWPGNIRELEHVIERAIVITDTDLITLESIQNILEYKMCQKNVFCTELMPLKLAKKELEEQLVKRAYELYKSTYKAAEVLEVDQSTVVKILKKYR